MLFDPNVVIEMFIFDRPASQDAVAATAHGQLAHDDTGVAPDEDALDERSGTGQ